MELLRMRIKDLMGDIKVKEIMNTELTSIDPSMNIIDALKDQFLHFDYSTLPVVSENKLIGLINLSNVKKLPRQQWNNTKVSKVMNKISDNNSLQMEDKVTVALTKVVKTRLDLLPVVEGGELIGVVTQDDILKTIERKKDSISRY